MWTIFYRVVVFLGYLLLLWFVGCLAVVLLTGPNGPDFISILVAVVVCGGLASHGAWYLFYYVPYLSSLEKEAEKKD